MRSSSVTLAVLHCLAASACTDDAALLVLVSGQATVPLELVPSFDGVPAKQGEYRWELVEAPEGSRAADPIGTKQATFQPDLRGQYLAERWLTYGLGEDLTHRFVIEVNGIRPVATIRVAQSVNVQTTVVADGALSSSFEGFPLSYHWRLTAKPAGSLTVIDDTDAQASFVPDTSGDYFVELSVFDGELWSDPAVANVQATP